MRVISSISIKFFETSSNGQMCELQNMHLPFMNRKYTAAGKGVAKVFGKSRSRLLAFTVFLCGKHVLNWPEIGFKFF